MMYSRKERSRSNPPAFILAFGLNSARSPVTSPVVSITTYSIVPEAVVSLLVASTSNASRTGAKVAFATASKIGRVESATTV